MTRDQLAIIGDKAGHDPAELDHAGGDLGNLVRTVHFGTAGVRFQAVELSSLDRVRGEAVP